MDERRTQHGVFVDGRFVRCTWIVPMCMGRVQNRQGCTCPRWTSAQKLVIARERLSAAQPNELKRALMRLGWTEVQASELCALSEWRASRSPTERRAAFRVIDGGKHG